MIETVPAIRNLDEQDIRRLVGRLEALVPRDGPNGEARGDRAALAALRRGLGKEPGEAPEMFPVLLPLLPEDRLFPRDERVAYLVATLFAFHPETWPAASRHRWRSNLGASMRRLARQTESNGPERRFIALLNSDEPDLPHHLRGIVGLLRAAEDPIWVDWSQLTRDLLRWTRPDREVQRRWAHAFWGGRDAPEEEAPAPDEPT